MEVIITNALISIAIIGEIMYMFTCGQDYIKANIKRARRLFWIDRFVFICIGITAITSALFDEYPSISNIMFKAFVASYLGRKCLSVYKYRQGLKRKYN